jgi:hypothetical protein
MGCPGQRHELVDDPQQRVGVEADVTVGHCRAAERFDRQFRIEIIRAIGDPEVVGRRLGGLTLPVPQVRDEQAAADDRYVLDIGDDRIASLRCCFGDQVVPDESWC